VNRCDRPLDPIDAEALASGAEPVYAEDAAEHAASCAACGASLERARRLTAALEGLSRALPPPPDLADRVTRLRSFSSRERRTYALWRAPILLSAGLSVAGLALLVGPSVSAGDQAGLGAAALAPVLAFVRSLGRWAVDLARVAPAGLDALSEALARDRSVGLASLVLLLPSAFGLTRVFARVRSRRS
jgi:predicted anti-sigma-YlaC factor YlaD